MACLSWLRPTYKLLGLVRAVLTFTLSTRAGVSVRAGAGACPGPPPSRRLKPRTMLSLLSSGPPV